MSTRLPPPPVLGLIGGVMVGLVTAKALAMASDKPLIAINHLEGHALSPRLADPSLQFPYLLLLVSGGHCQMLLVEGVGQYRRLAPPSTTRWARRSTRPPRSWGWAIPAARRWSGWRPRAMRKPVPCRARCWAARSRISRSRA
jgi:hypothetical protein